MTAIGGKYQVRDKTGLNIREAPSTKAKIVGGFKYGETVILDNVAFVADGYIWGRYTGASSGKKRYIALGTHELVSRV